MDSAPVFCPHGHPNPAAAAACTDCGAHIYATDEVIRWAHCYDGYKRLAAGAPALAELLRPLRQALADTGAIPGWAGLDLLRGWAFLLVRVDTHRGGGGAGLGTEFAAVVDAIDAHPGAAPRERSPLDRSVSCCAQARPQPAPAGLGADSPRE